MIINKRLQHLTNKINLNGLEGINSYINVIIQTVIRNQLLTKKIFTYSIIFYKEYFTFLDSIFELHLTLGWNIQSIVLKSLP